MNIDDHILIAAKEVGRRQHKFTGEVLSGMIRKALTGSRAPQTKVSRPVYGFRPIPKVPGKIANNDMIIKRRDEELF